MHLCDTASSFKHRFHQILTECLYGIVKVFLTHNTTQHVLSSYLHQKEMHRMSRRSIQLVEATSNLDSGWDFHKVHSLWIDSEPMAASSLKRNLLTNLPIWNSKVQSVQNFHSYAPCFEMALFFFGTPHADAQSWRGRMFRIAVGLGLVRDQALQRGVALSVVNIAWQLHPYLPCNGECIDVGKENLNLKLHLFNGT